jgi:hypothetical protein
MMLYISLPLQMLFLPWVTSHEYKWITLPWRRSHTHDQLKAHLTDFLNGYNFARRLNTLKGLTPYEYLCKFWTQTPNRFTLKPYPPNAGTKHLVSPLLSLRLISTRSVILSANRLCAQLRLCASQFRHNVAALLRHVATTKWGTKRYLQINRLARVVPSPDSLLRPPWALSKATQSQQPSKVRMKNER